MPKHSTPGPRVVALPHTTSGTMKLPNGQEIDFECESYPLPPDAPLVAEPMTMVRLPAGTRIVREQ